MQIDGEEGESMFGRGKVKAPRDRKVSARGPKGFSVVCSTIQAQLQKKFLATQQSHNQHHPQPCGTFYLRFSSGILLMLLFPVLKPATSVPARLSQAKASHSSATMPDNSVSVGPSATRTSR
jgi:hypothetical protein